MDSTAAPSASSAPPALPDPPALTVLTQNIRCEVPGTRPGQADHWPERAPVLGRLLRAAEADVVGTQEVLPAQLPVLDEALGATHLRLGTGREEGGGGEHNLLFLRRERFEVLAQQQFWLSERPERAGSLGWDAHCPRIAVLARVWDRASAQEMVLAVTHLDHAGEVARARGAALLAARLTDAAGEAPVVLMGDFNAAAGGSAPWRTLREAGFEDAHAAAVHRGEDIGTFTDYGPPQAGGTRIDWILTRGLAVEEYAATVPQHGGRAASDHATVMARVLLPST